MALDFLFHKPVEDADFSAEEIRVISENLIHRVRQKAADAIADLLVDKLMTIDKILSDRIV
jgi:F420-dependent methylenetetrahydromethanopterin dehydrogenase